MAEGNPLADNSPLAAPLVAVTRLVLRSPGVVLGGAVMLAVLSVLVTVNGLSFKTSRLDLLNPRSEYNQRWLAYLSEFGRRDDAVIVVRAERQADLTRAIDDLAEALSQQPELFESIFFRRDLSNLRSKALHFVPAAELAKIEGDVARAAAMFPRDGASADPAAALAQLNDRLAHIASASPQVRTAVDQEYQRVAAMTLAALASDVGGSAGGEPAGLVYLPLAAAHFEPQYLLADEGRMGFVLLKLKVDDAEFARGSRAIGQLRSTIAAARGRHPAAWIGLTGMPVIEFDEMQASQTDMLWTSLVSFAAVAALFVAGYGGLRHTILANVVLLLAMAWSFGFVTLAVGHLNILSSAFAVVLIGLGIDYAIHYIACYLRLRKEGLDPESALIGMAQEVGPGMVTGGVTTAAAFFMAGMTDFVGVRELGVIAGSGILLCVVATITVFPPLILIVDRNWPQTRLPQMLPTARFLNLPLAKPRLTMLITGVGTLVVATGIGLVRYDHNLLNLQPRHIESADIERLILTRMDDSVWFAVSLCDTPAELVRRKAAFDALPTVAKTEDIVSLLATHGGGNREVINAIRQHVAGLPASVPPPPTIDRRRLLAEIGRAQSLLAKETPYETPATALLAQLRAAVLQTPDAAFVQRLASTQANLAQHSYGQLAALRELCDPQPPQLTDLPPELVDRFVGASHKHLLRIYARGDIWDMEQLQRFVEEVESVDPRVTGHPVQTFYASRHMQQGYIWAGVYALAAVFVFLWFDFRSIRHSLLAMVPLLLGFVQMCGLIGWLGIPFNAANMIALPLILGIGVDDGVHLVHELRRGSGRFRMRNATSIAVLLISTTTTASFGALILARHQGLQSLGQVLTLGVTTCLFSSIFFFPALLAWLTRKRPDESAIESPAASIPLIIVPEVPCESSPAAETSPQPDPAVAVAAEVASEEQQLADQVELEVAALVLAADVPADSRAAAGTDALEELPTMVPRRRLRLEPGEEVQPPHAPLVPGRRGSVLRHLAGIRHSDR